MNKAITTVSVASVRTSNSDKAEMMTQLLFGESVEILDTKKDWWKIKSHYDGSEGWVDAKQLVAISDEDFAERTTEIITERVLYYNHKEEQFLLSIGSEVVRENPVEPVPEDLRQTIMQMALGFLNVPYLWGGRSFFGVDASGFVQIIYKANGIKLPREAAQQVEYGEVLDFVEEAEAGDLAFFENEDGKITHTGIMLENQEVIHAYGKVRIDVLDSIGIFNKDLNKHTHKLRFIKKIL
ncbi:MAG: C40 family peptidase [Bergeyella zoohelcum]|nr:C40 family peptidase [Bergeyella zoohelcum]